ncbi:MAG: cell division protein FtsA [Patescibacteria group bacterium]
MRQQLICGIDIGNTAVKTVIAEINRELSRPQIIAIASVPSGGLRRGVVVDMEETIANIGQSVKQAEAMAGAKISRAYVSINGLHIKSQLSHGVIAVSRADNEISQYDIERVVDAAAAISIPANREVIHIMPRNFIIDGQEHVKNPLGMKGVRLEADVLIIDGLSPYIRNLAKCLNANDLEVAEFIFTPLATAKAVLDKHQKEHGVLNLDCGGGLSTLALFHEGELIHAATLPVGSRHITNDLAIAFRTSMDRAEDIKCQHGFAGSDDVSIKDHIDLSELLEEEKFIIPKKQIARIVDARVSELFDLIGDEMKKVQHGYLLPAGVVLAGGGANLSGLAALTKNRLKLSVKIGGSQTEQILPGAAASRISDPSFATAIGLVIWGIEKEFQSKGGSFLSSGAQGTLGKTLRWLKNFLP